MTDFEAAWSLTRGRFLDAIAGLSDAQLAWIPYPGALSVGQMAYHVAGVEASFALQLTQTDGSPAEQKIAAAARDGVINESPFPFGDADMTATQIDQALASSKALVEPLIQNPDPYRPIEIVSALGPVIDGTGAFARLAYHAGYHQGQVYLVKTHPGFPAS